MDLQCTSGNKPCGKRCIPQNHACLTGSTKALVLGTGVASLAGGGLTAAHMYRERQADKALTESQKLSNESLNYYATHIKPESDKAFKEGNIKYEWPADKTREFAAKTKASKAARAHYKELASSSDVLRRGGKAATGVAALLGVGAAAKHLLYDKKKQRGDSIWATGFENEPSESL